MTKTILITGGAGFIGCNTIKYIRENSTEDIEFAVLDNLHPQVHRTTGWPADLPTDVKLFTGDVANAENWDTVLKLVQPSVIIHLAAETGTGQSLTEASRHGRVNVVGTTEMLDALHRNSIKPDHIILASSRAVYGDGMWKSDTSGELFSVGTRTHADLEKQIWDYADAKGSKATAVTSRADQTFPRPTNVYAATKLAQEQICRAWCTAFEVPLTILRFQNVYGPGQSLENSYTGIVALFSRLAYEKQPIKVYEDGEIIRDFVYVLDVSQAIHKSIQTPPALTDERVLDVGSGEATTVHNIAKKIATIADSPEPVITGAFRDGDVRAASCDISQTAAKINYIPEWPLDRGLAALYAWVSETA